MIKRDLLGVQAERRGVDFVGLSFAQLLIWQVRLLALNRPTKVPQVDANLIGAARDWPRFDKRCSIGETV
jgi:hypothetical protein